MDGLILLPSKGRPGNVVRYINHHVAQGGSLPHVLIIEQEERQLYNGVLPPGWIVRAYKGGKGAASHYNKIFSEFPDLGYYGYTNDDVIPRTVKWDVKLRDNCLATGFAWPDDGEKGEKFACFGFIRGDIVRAAGSLNPMEVDHFGFDNFWFHMLKKRGTYCRGVLLEHMHPRLGKAAEKGYMEGSVSGNLSNDMSHKKYKAYKNSPAWQEMKCRLENLTNK